MLDSILQEYSHLIKEIPEVIEVQRFLSEDCSYDESFISYDENGIIQSVQNQCVEEFEKTKKGTCLDGVFYAASKLKEKYGTQMIKCLPIMGIRLSQEKNRYIQGLGHALYLFEHNNKFGAISFSRIQKLEFQLPIFEKPEEVYLLNWNLHEGFEELYAPRGLKPLGIAGDTLNIEDLFIEYETTLKKSSNGDSKKFLKGHLFD